MIDRWDAFGACAAALVLYAVYGFGGRYWTALAAGVACLVVYIFREVNLARTKKAGR